MVRRGAHGVMPLLTEMTAYMLSFDDTQGCS